jgi:hypothetical protein
VRVRLGGDLELVNLAQVGDAEAVDVGLPSSSKGLTTGDLRGRPPLDELARHLGAAHTADLYSWGRRLLC